MNEDNNNPQTPPVSQQPVEIQPLVPVTTPPIPATPQPDVPKKPGMSRNKKIMYGLAVLLVIVAAVTSWWLLRPAPADTQLVTQTKKTAVPVDEEVRTDEVDCGDRSGFGDQSIGMKFCYPAEWGAPSVLDAKLDPADTGNRQVIKFADMPYVQVGGVSGDWTTTVGRDGICFDPTNVYPEASSYNTEWHDQIGSGADLEFALRSIAVSSGGYAMREEVSNVLQSGVCVRGIKEITTPNYRYGSISYYRDFAEASGVTTPAQHIASPNVLVSTQMRADINAVMASLEKY